MGGTLGYIRDFHVAGTIFSSDKEASPHMAGAIFDLGKEAAVNSKACLITKNFWLWGIIDAPQCLLYQHHLMAVLGVVSRSLC